MSLNALDIVLDLALHTSFADTHAKYIVQEGLELGVLSEWTVNAVFAFICKFLASLGDHNAVKSKLIILGRTL